MYAYIKFATASTIKAEPPKLSMKELTWEALASMCDESAYHLRAAANRLTWLKKVAERHKDGN
jgi:hypothetical protein